MTCNKCGKWYYSSYDYCPYCGEENKVAKKKKEEEEKNKRIAMYILYGVCALAAFGCITNNFFIVALLFLLVIILLFVGGLNP